MAVMCNRFGGGTTLATIDRIVAETASSR
jgi:hypothetical protein